MYIEKLGNGEVKDLGHSVVSRRSYCCKNFVKNMDIAVGSQSQFVVMKLSWQSAVVQVCGLNTSIRSNVNLQCIGNRIEVSPQF